MNIRRFVILCNGSIEDIEDDITKEKAEEILRGFVKDNKESGDYRLIELCELVTIKEVTFEETNQDKMRVIGGNNDAGKRG